MRWIDFTKKPPKGGAIVWCWMPGWATADLLEAYTRPDKDIGFVSLMGEGAIEGITHWQTMRRPKPPVAKSISKTIQKANRSEN